MKRTNINFYTKFAKVDAAKRMVYGYCTSEAVDSQGEVVSKEAIRKAWKKYMEYGNVREMHQPSAVGVTKEYSHDDTGTWIGVKVVDAVAWEKVEEGVYKGFSIGGRVISQTDNVIEEIVLAEISLVDRPANPDAKFSVIKVDDGLVETERLQAIINSQYHMKKFIEIDGKKYVEDPENPGNALTGDNGEKVEYSEADAAEAAAAKEAEDAEAAAAAAEKEKADAEAKAKAEEDAKATDADAAAKAEADAKAQEEADAKAKADADAATAEAEKAAASDIKKDADGVLTMAGVLDHIEYAMACFASQGKDPSSLQAAKDAIMEVIAAEAKEKESAASVGDLTKAQGEMSKAFATIVKDALAPVAEQIKKLSEEVEVIKNTKTSPRPKAAFAVEKGFEGGDENALSVDEARKAVDAVKSEIDTFSTEMQSILKTDPSRNAEMQTKATALHKKYADAKAVLTTAMAQG